jgi:hypothetical protein
MPFFVLIAVWNGAVVLLWVVACGEKDRHTHTQSGGVPPRSHPPLPGSVQWQKRLDALCLLAYDMPDVLAGGMPRSSAGLVLRTILLLRPTLSMPRSSFALCIHTGGLG